VVQQDLQLLVVGGLAACGGGRSRLSPNILQQPEKLAVVSSVVVPDTDWIQNQRGPWIRVSGFTIRTRIQEGKKVETS
jgi:hypothetical protein